MCVQSGFAASSKRGTMRNCLERIFGYFPVVVAINMSFYQRNIIIICVRTRCVRQLWGIGVCRYFNRARLRIRSGRRNNNFYYMYTSLIQNPKKKICYTRRIIITRFQVLITLSFRCSARRRFHNIIVGEAHKR